MTAKKYTPAETARLRDRVLREDIAPVIRSAFHAHPALRSATLLVAQYWCDEADDAVHCDLIFSELDTPDTEAAYRARRRRDGDEDTSPATGWRRWFSWLGLRSDTATSMDGSPMGAAPFDVVNLPSESDDTLSDELEQKYTWQLPWDSNDESISLFAAFCLEGCHQEMRAGEAYTPYAIFRRKDDEVDIEVVGVMTRPWLDGVMHREAREE
jgi:hypothetical protein